MLAMSSFIFFICRFAAIIFDAMFRYADGLFAAFRFLRAIR